MKKIIVVTGASSGMGVCFARQLACEKPDELWIVARRKDRLENLKKEIESEKSVKVRVVDIDVSGSEGARRFKAVLDAERNSGDFEISVLVNNAGFGTLYRTPKRQNRYLSRTVLRSRNRISDG